MLVWRTTGRSAFRDMPDVAGWNTDFLICAPNGLLACCAAMDGYQRNSDWRDSFAHPA